MEVRGMDFIGEYTISYEICDKLIEHFESPYIPKIDGMNARDMASSWSDSVDVLLDGVSKDAYKEELLKCVREYVEKWPNCIKLVSDWGVQEEISIQKYAPGRGHKAIHCDRTDGKGKFCKRLLAFTTYLNDMSDGGEIEFEHQNRTIKPAKGRTVIWPVDWTHAHQVCASNLETKYVITGWISFAYSAVASRCKPGDSKGAASSSGS